MTYSPLGFIQSPAHTAPVPGARPLDAAAMQHIEAGIASAHAALDALDARTDALEALGGPGSVTVISGWAAIDHGDGTVTLSGQAVTDNGDGTLTLTI